jgi:hypothetical protein
MKSLACLLGAAIFAAACHAPAEAATTTYDYLGNSYTVQFGCNDVTCGDHMTGSVTFDFDTTGVSGTFALSGGQIADLSLTSGPITAPTAAISPSSSLTLTAGAITSWVVFHSAPSVFLLTQNGDPNFPRDHIDLAGFGAVIDFNPGVWTLVSATDPSAVPLPAALPLFASVLGLGGIFGYRRRRQAAAL